MPKSRTGCDEEARHEVLITRPEAEAAATAAQVRALGFKPVVAPLLRVGTRALHWPAGVSGVVLSSGNAVACLPRDHGLPVFAVGDATAARVRAAGAGPVHSAGGDATDLVALVCRHCPPGAALLLVTGEGVGQGTAAALRSAGFRVLRRVGYAARPVARLPGVATESLRAGRLRAGLFLSAETARTFARLLPVSLHPALAGVEALAIGQPAAMALALLPWRRVRVSVGPTLEQVLALL